MPQPDEGGLDSKDIDDAKEEAVTRFHDKLQAIIDDIR